MTKVRVTYATSASPAACWALMADFAKIDLFNPHLSQSRLIGGPAVCGIGTERQCDLKDGRGFLRERIIDWKDGRSYTVEIFDSSFPVDKMVTTLGLMPRQDGSDLYMETSYQPRLGWIGAVADRLALRWIMRGMLKKVLVGLAERARATPQLQTAA